jgi:hypothetical protein
VLPDAAIPRGFRDHAPTLVQLDVSTLGISREKHHRDATMQGVLLNGSDGCHGCIGYLYVSATGHVSPLVVAQARWMGAAFRTALDVAGASGAAQVSAFLSGVSEALGAAGEHGIRITFPTVLVSTRDVGDWTRYLPRNPGFIASCDHASRITDFISREKYRVGTCTPHGSLLPRLAVIDAKPPTSSCPLIEETRLAALRCGNTDF